MAPNRQGSQHACAIGLQSTSLEGFGESKAYECASFYAAATSQTDCLDGPVIMLS